MPSGFWKNQLIKEGPQKGHDSDSCIYNINVVAGKNGAGKTTVINYLTDLLSYIYRGFREVDEETEESQKAYRATIRKCLYEIIQAVKIDRKGNLLESSFPAIVFFRDFLNILYGWNLKIVDSPQYFAIDLIDRDNNIAVQVSHNTNRRKMQDSIARFSEYDIREEHSSWHFYFLTLSDNTPKNEIELQVPEGLIFDGDHILDMSSLIEKVNHDADFSTLQQLKRLTEAYVLNTEEETEELLGGAETFRTSEHRNLLVFEVVSCGTRHRYILDLRPKSISQFQLLLAPEGCMENTMVIGGDGFFNYFAEKDFGAFLGEFRKLKVIYLTNTLNRRDLNRQPEGRAVFRRNGFVYNCSVGADLEQGLSAHYANEQSIQADFMFDRSQESLIDSVFALKLPNTVTVWLRRSLLVASDYSPLLAVAKARTGHLAPTNSLTPAELLCALGAAAYVAASSKHFGISAAKLLSGRINVFKSEQTSLVSGWERALSAISAQLVRPIKLLENGTLVGTTWNGTLTLGDLKKGKWDKLLKGHTSRILCAAALPDGSLVTGSIDHNVRIWDLTTGNCLQTLKGHSKQINCVAVLRDGRIISGSADGYLRIWDRTHKKNSIILKGHSGRIICVAVFQDGRVVSGSLDNTLRIWNVDTGQCQQVLKGHSAPITCVTTLPDGRIVNGSEDNRLYVWNPQDGTRQIILDGHYAPVFSVTALPDGRIVSGSNDRTLRIWNPNTGECLNTLVGQSAIESFDVLPDGTVVSINADSVIQLLDLETGDCREAIRPADFDFGSGLGDRCRDFLRYICENEERINTLPRAGNNDEGFELPLKSGTQDLRFAREFLAKSQEISKALTILDYSWGLSSGEENMLRLFAMLHSAFGEDEAGRRAIHNREALVDEAPVDCDSVLLLMDEADLTLHPDWQRRLIDILTTAIPKLFPREIIRDVQLLLSTHSPLLLGDIPAGNVHYLGPEQAGVNTFGQNIHTILKDGFFLDQGTIGEFAAKKINGIAKRLKEFLAQKDAPSKADAQELSDIRGMVDLVAPGLIRAKLESMLLDAEGRLKPEAVSKDARSILEKAEALSTADRLFLLQKLAQRRKES